jgi:dephospho-CoA kinase
MRVNWGFRALRRPLLRSLHVIEIGLTGGIGSGKSTVAEMLVAKGAVLIDADQIVREVQRPGTPVFAAMVDRWGPRIVAADGQLERAAVAAIAFSDPAELEALNSIVHPAVGAEMTRRREALAPTDATVVLDIPLLTESGYSGLAGVIVVDVEPDVAVARLVAQRGFSEADARARVSRQASRVERLAIADFVVDNSGTLDDLRHQVDECWAWILSLPRPEPGAPVVPIRGRGQN